MKTVRDEKENNEIDFEGPKIYEKHTFLKHFNHFK